MGGSTMRGCQGRLLLVAAAALCIPGTEAFGEAPKWLLVSSPSTGRISYRKLPHSGAPAAMGTATSLFQRGLTASLKKGVSFEQSDEEDGTMQDLITEGLTFPQGLAVDQYRKNLYVADPNLGKLVSYPLKHSRNKLKVGQQRVVADGVEVRAVSVDGLGNVFFTEEPTGRIMRVTASKIDEGNTTAETVYDSGSSKGVSQPGGIALDNYFVYWLNKQGGTGHGTLLRARQNPHPESLLNVTKYQVNGSHAAMLALASNAEKCYGLCLALGNIFYTDESTNLYGIHRASTAQHDPVTISTALQQPRGCAHDGDGTVYVADKKGNAVYQFASNMQELTENRPLTKAADLVGAFGVAVYVQTED